LDESRQHQISSEENQNQNFPKQSSSSYEESRDVPCENDNETATGVDLLDSNIENGNCDHAGKNLVFWMEDMVLKPFRDMSILSRNHTLRLIALGSFLASTVYNVDHTLVLFYIEQHLDVRDKDMASMLFVLGIVGVIMQCLAFQPLVQCFGERGLLIITFVSGTVHNFIYGAARKKSSIYSALALSQLTKLNFPILSSLSSQQADPHEQGQLQGALFALNALAGAFGPLAMNVVYQHTKDGTMFLASSGLYFTGLVAVLALSRDSKHLLRQEPIGRTDVQNRADSSDEVDREDMEEPLLPLEI
jgi:DHA1 family tetracycline resistance protein-like MFS transporter